MHFTIWTNTFCDLDNYILCFGQIYFVIWTNKFYNLDKCILQFGQIHLTTCKNIFTEALIWKAHFSCRADCGRLIWYGFPCLVLQGSCCIQVWVPPVYMDIGQVGSLFHVSQLLGKILVGFNETGLVEYSYHRWIKHGLFQCIAITFEREV